MYSKFKLDLHKLILSVYFLDIPQPPSNFHFDSDSLCFKWDPSPQSCINYYILQLERGDPQNITGTEYCLAIDDIDSIRSVGDSAVCNNTVSGFNGTHAMGNVATLDWCIDGNV